MKILIGLSLLMSSPVFGFTLTSTTNPGFKGWADANISFQINASNCPAGADVNGVINSALAIWNNVASSRVKLSVAGSTTSTTSSNPITVYCETNYEVVLGMPGANAGSPGAAVGLPTTGDYFTSGTLYLNASSGNANIANYSSALLSVILAHEIGHLLGLGHSQDLNALMYYNASLKTTLGLAQDDIDGVTYLYPRNELSGDKPLGCALVKDSRPPSTRGFLTFTILMLLPLLMIFVLRRRRKSLSSFEI